MKININSMLLRFFKFAALWIWGGAIYTLCELLWRGYSHPSMFVVGGLCFVVIGGTNRLPRRKMGFLAHTLLGTAAVTAVELASGLILNKLLGLGVWDYSKMPLNLWGQICPQYIVAWMPLTAFGITLNGLLKHALFGESKPRYSVIETVKKLTVSLCNLMHKASAAEAADKQIQPL